jgi:hypothetical protein
MSEVEAAKLATEHFGRPEAIARKIYEVHSRGNWQGALFAAMPHLFVALFFAWHLWSSPGWLAALLVSILAIAAYGWWHGKPSWLYPWLGYCLVPILVAALFSFYVLGQALFYFLAGSGPEPDPWMLLASFACILLALWLLVSLVTKAVQRDWLYGSLMVLPLPALACWLLVLRQGGFLEYNEQYLQNSASWLALSFLVLAVGVAAFIRLGQRRLKGGALAGAGLSIFLILAYINPGGLSSMWLGVAALLSMAFLFSPAVLKHRRGHRQ